MTTPTPATNIIVPPATLTGLFSRPIASHTIAPTAMTNSSEFSIALRMDELPHP